jgi:hypothetical protein
MDAAVLSLEPEPHSHRPFQNGNPPSIQRARIATSSHGHHSVSTVITILLSLSSHSVVTAIFAGRLQRSTRSHGQGHIPVKLLVYGQTKTFTAAQKITAQHRQIIRRLIKRIALPLSSKGLATGLLHGIGRELTGQSSSSSIYIEKESLPRQFAQCRSNP